MDLSENEQMIIRYLYWNHDKYKTRDDIRKETDLSYEQVRKACNDLLDKNCIDNNPKEQDNISDKHRYMINPIGINYVKNNDLKKSEKAELREEVRNLRKEVMTQDESTVPLRQMEEDVTDLKIKNKKLRKKVSELERENDYLMHYVKQFIQVAGMEGYELEPYKQE